MRILVALLFVSAAAAQLSPEQDTLYANRGDDWYLAFEQVESSSTGQVPVTDDNPQERTLPLTSPLDDDATLEEGQDVVFVLYYTGEGSAGGVVPVVLAGQIDVTVELRQGETIIANGTSQDNLVSTGVTEVLIQVPPQTRDIEAGELEWFIRESGTAAGALFLPDGGDGEWSRIELAVADVFGGPSGPERINLTGDTVSLSVTYDEPTTKTVTYNWTNSLDDLQIVHNVTVTAGAVHLNVTDPDGVSVVDVDTDSDDNGTFEWEDPIQGNWTIEVAYTDFTGTLHLQIAPMGDGTDTTTRGGNGTTTNNGTETDGDRTTTDEDTPALAPVLVLAVLALWAFRRRDV